MKNKDTVYALPRSQIGKFVFDEAVASVFSDMIERSVPGYAAVLSMTSMLAARYARAGTRCYDLGCSLGAATLAIAQGVEEKGCRIIAVDNAPAMIEQCRANIAGAGSGEDIELVCGDVREIEVREASLVVLNYTLQFIAPAERLHLLKAIYRGLQPGGALILSEKIAFPNPEEQALMTELHLDFKRAHGYSDLEIAQKRTALENVLIPDTLAVHLKRLKEVGFVSSAVWFQCLNFVSLLGLKDED